MAVPFIKTSFTAGEVSPSLFGHTDLSRFQNAASTMRNLFVSYTGGAFSRAGTAFAGFSKQTALGTGVPPRLIPFQFSINQGLALEFGQDYMRVLLNGAYVTEATKNIIDATQADPCIITLEGEAATAAAYNAGGLTSYAPADTITMAGGTFTSPAILTVTNTELKSLGFTNRGTGYAGADTINLAGGTQTTTAVLQVVTTRVVSATVGAGGAGGTPGAAVVTGTTGTGTLFTANVTISGGGAISAVNSIATQGSYTVNPTSPDPVTGGSLTGATLNVVMEIDTLAIINNGVFTVNPPGGVLTQGSTSGSGINAAFAAAIMVPHTLTVSTPGAYTVTPSNPVSQSATSGSGTGATFNLTFGALPISYSNGDWVYVADVGGMTQLNGRTFVVANKSGASFELNDVFGNDIDSTGYSAYTSGGTVARIYTPVSPYAAVDLPWLKYTQSADVMSLTCWNQQTNTSYPPYDLARLADDNWSFTILDTSASIGAPAAVNVVATVAGGADPTDYQYVVTAVGRDGQESVASPIGDEPNSVNIASTAGSLKIEWNPVATAAYYNIYKAPPAFKATIPPGALFAYMASAYGTSAVDSNIVPDASLVPPLHKNPFNPGQILAVTITDPGTGLGAAVITFAVTTVDGTGLTGYAVVDSGGAVTCFVVTNGGGFYQASDTITFSATAGTPPTGMLVVGPETGTYPSVVSYFQQRRVYAGSPNNPDTYWFSQPGAFKNFDSRIPTIDSDAITGTPWSLQVNGVQAMVPMPGGLVVLAGAGAWQLTGQGGGALTPLPITPSSQQAQPQAYNGISPTVPPIKVDYDILYVQAKGSIVRDLAYNFVTNIYTGVDLTELSSHLFAGFTIREWAWCEEPFKICWAVRNDGVLLSLTFVKPEEVAGWARHDTQGLVFSVCSVTELPVDALYLVVQRITPAGIAFMVERMNNRIWDQVEDAWCVDSALELTQPEPAAAISATSPTGLGAISGVTNLVGGHGYGAATAINIVDDDGNGPGMGAILAPVVVGGVIVSVTVDSAGSGYVRPRLDIIDPSNEGTGARADAVLDNSTTFVATASVFSMGDVGSVIRMGGGIATITAYTSGTQVTGQITQPIVAVIPNTDPPIVIPQAEGDWTMTAPVTSVGGLDHLAGMYVTGLCDGRVLTPSQVSPSGTVFFQPAASSVTLGLGFTAQLQSVYLDVGNPTVQGQRKKIAAVTARVENSRDLKMGANQTDGSTLSPMEVAPPWQNLDDVPNLVPAPYANVEDVVRSAPVPLYTGNVRIPVPGGFDQAGQVALEQSQPLPMNVLALVPEVLPGDNPQAQAARPPAPNLAALARKAAA